MSLTGHSIGKPLMAMVVLGYFAMLAVLLVWFHMPPLYVLAATVGGIGLMTIAVRPYWGLLAFVAINFFENVASPGGGPTAMQIVGGIIFAGWLLNSALRHRAPASADALTLVGLLFVAWSAVTILVALDGEAAVSRIVTFTQLLVAALMFASVVDTREKARGVFVAIVVWCTLTTAIAIAQYYLGRTEVAVGPVGNRNLLATYVNCGIVCVPLLHQATSRWAERLLIALCLPVLFLGLGLTFSRTGLIVQAIALVLVWYRVAREKGFLMLVGSALALGLIALLLPTNFYKRASTIVPTIERQEGTFGTRVRIWKTGIRMIQARPVAGVGAGNFTAQLPRYSHGDFLISGLGAHNAYIGVGAETGLVGLGLFVTLLLTTLSRARRSIRAARVAGAKDLEMVAIMCEISIVVIALSGFTGSVEGLKYLWLLLGMTFAVHRILVAPPKPVAASEAASVDDVRMWTLAPGDTK